jgi:hypothetical protein
MEDDRNGTDPPGDDDLDREHQARYSRVARNDTKAGKDEAARNESGRLVEEVQELNARRDGLGSDDHIEACRRCKWSPYALKLWFGSRLAWFKDIALWIILWGGLWWMWVRYYRDSGETVPIGVYLAVVAVPVLAILCAKAVKGLGQHIAVTRLTDPNSVDESVSGQVRFAGGAAMIAGVFLLSILALLFFSPPSWASWITYVSGLLGFGANVALGMSAGVGGNAAELLLKPAERDDIDCKISMKQRLRRLLKKFYLAVLLALVVLGGGQAVRAGDDGQLGGVVNADHQEGLVLVKAVDITASADPVQRELGIASMVDRAPEQARELGAVAVLVVTFADEVLLSDMAWVPVPPMAHEEDCDHVSSALRVTKGLMGFSPTVAKWNRDRAVAACLARRDGARALVAEQDRRAREQLRRAMRVTPRDDVRTKLAPLLQKFFGRPYVLAIEVLTDGVDNSGVPITDVVVPDGVSVTLIITRPNPERRSPTLRDVLEVAEAWDRIDGITVTTVSEYAGFSTLAEAR